MKPFSLPYPKSIIVFLSLIKEEGCQKNDLFKKKFYFRF
ncbi:hypothetical protein LEP1GSC049_0114 [Leptospira kirschneri serovar Cynopteri str. 3522 CT]|nr:hypothetical protein LEP1GSC049_0114 [Leptospira kirschneri serovar Cynopteri str. 3522 CT]